MRAAGRRLGLVDIGKNAAAILHIAAAGRRQFHRSRRSQEQPRTRQILQIGNSTGHGRRAHIEGAGCLRKAAGIGGLDQNPHGLKPVHVLTPAHYSTRWNDILSFIILLFSRRKKHLLQGKQA